MRGKKLICGLLLCILLFSACSDGEYIEQSSTESEEGSDIGISESDVEWYPRNDAEPVGEDADWDIWGNTVSICAENNMAITNDGILWGWGENKWLPAQPVIIRSNLNQLKYLTVWLLSVLEEAMFRHLEMTARCGCGGVTISDKLALIPRVPLSCTRKK